MFITAVILLAFAMTLAPSFPPSAIPPCCRGTSCSMMRHHLAGLGIRNCHGGDAKESVAVDAIALVPVRHTLVPTLANTAKIARVMFATIARAADVQLPPPRVVPSRIC